MLGLTVSGITIGCWLNSSFNNSSSSVLLLENTSVIFILVLVFFSWSRMVSTSSIKVFIRPYEEQILSYSSFYGPGGDLRVIWGDQKLSHELSS